jgi:CHAD domain-containing protein
MDANMVSTSESVQPDDQLSADDRVAVAGWKIMSHHFRRMLKHEKAVWEGGDPEGIHDMRVSTRRLRSTMQIFEPFCGGSTITKLRKRLGKVADALGTVRDLDVFLEHVQAFRTSHTNTDELEPFADYWNARQQEARRDLLDMLDGDEYADLLDDFKVFLEQPCEQKRSEPKPLVRHVVGYLIYARYSDVRMYETVLEEAVQRSEVEILHELRIAGKRFRYLLEAFESVLGENASTVITATKALQEHLGQLQDAHVAIARLQDYIQHTPRAAITEYMAARMRDQESLLADVPSAWTAFTDPGIRRALANTVAVL